MSILFYFRGALNSLGFKMAYCYYDPNLFKTDAPAEVIYDIFKKYKTDNYTKENLYKNMIEDSYKMRILRKEVIHQATFYEFKGDCGGKFLENPTKNWGPKAKAKLVKYTYNILSKLIK